MSVEYNGQSSQTHARLITDYIAMDGFCLQLYHLTREFTILQVKSRGEDYVERLLADVTQVKFSYSRGDNPLLPP